MLHTLLSVSIIFFIIYGIEGSGVSPEELFVRVNDTFTIRCSVDIASGELNFYDDDKLVPNGSIKRISDRHIELTQMYTQRIRKNFTCKKNNQSNVGRSTVRVDDKVDPVENFKCRTSNLTTVTCTFKQPKSFVPIKYKLSFSLNGGKMKHKADLKGDGNFGYSSSINITTPNPSDTHLRLLLRANNKFFKREEKFEMKLLETLTPRKVEEIQVENSTTHSSAIVTFALPKELEAVSSEMVFDVRLADEFDKRIWRKIENPRLQVKGTQGFLALDDLEFANAFYKVKLRTKAKIARDNEEMWSPFVEVSFTTTPKVPERVPDTCRNCFNVMDTGNAMIYWTAVPRQYQNAKKFAYIVRGWNEHGDEVIHRNSTKTSMVLQRDLKAENLRIEIFTSNEKGISTNFSRLFVPLQQLKSVKSNLNIRKEILDSKYRISWKAPEQSDVESYTIISCHQRNELPNQCDGAISFINLPPETNEFVVETKMSKQFGIAANMRDKLFSEGFQWASCTASKQNEIGQVHSLWSNAATKNSITLQWELNCVDEPIVAGYNITYCPIDNVESPENCSEPLLWSIAMGNELRQFEIVNLKSYKLYSIAMALLSYTRHGIYKLPIIVLTLESAPTAPRKLEANNIFQHSVYLNWNRPQEVNGEAMTYQLWYNDRKININDRHTMNETFAYKLQELEAFTNYIITVVACTSYCSEPSESLTLNTAMAEPGQMFQPKLELLDGSKVSISWKEPKVAGGNLDYFQIKTILPTEKEAKVYRINGKARSCVIQGLKCENNNIDFSVRSVNVEYPSTVVTENELIDCFSFPEPIEEEVAGKFYGEWSQPVIYYCEIEFSFVVIGTIFLVSLFFLISIYLFIRLYHKYKEMKDIHIVLPKELDPNSQNSSPSKKDKMFDAIKDFDLIKDHVLTDIEEEDEEERRKFVSADEEFMVVQEKPSVNQRESGRSEMFLPFICNPKTNEIFYTMPKMSAVNERVKSTPASPKSDYVKFNPQADAQSDYVKMYTPIESPLNSPVAGYLDMSGKSPTSPSTPIILVSPPMPKESDYLVNEIKMFIKESEMNNNGYIGKRASVLNDASGKKHSTVVNSNGYVGLQQK